jgi:DNA-binding transcriptional LysR family regulator
MSLAGLDLNLLVVLDALFEEQSVTRAARRVGLTQPAMSNALGRLRIALGDPLFVRAGRGVVPTPRAMELLPEVHEALLRIERALQRTVAFSPASARRVFRIVTTDYVEMVLLPPLLARLREEAPGVELEVRAATAFPREALERGDVDLYAGVHSGDDPGMYVAALFTEGFTGVVRKGHPLLKGPLTPERYASYPHVLVAPRGARGGVVDRALEAIGLERRVVVLTPHYATAPQLLPGSDLVLTLSTRTARTFSSGWPLALFEPPVKLAPFSVSAVWHERHAKEEAHRWFRKLVSDVAKTV